MEELREGDEVPCAYSGHVLRSDQGTLLRYPSSAMKSRAIRKVDVGEFLKQADIKGATVVDVVVGEHGEVICVKG